MNVHSPKSSTLSVLRGLLASSERPGAIAAGHRCRSGGEPREPLSTVEACWELRSGMVQEWVADAEGSGAQELALWNARKSLRQEEMQGSGRWLVVDAEQEVCPAGWQGRGVDLARVVVVRVRDPVDLLWTVEQGLRSRGVELVVCRVDCLPMVAFRRLKLAAEVGGTRCLLLRGADALREPGWADLRLLVTPQRSTSWMKRRMRVELLKVRNGLPGSVFQVELDCETDCVRLVPELADSAAVYCSAGA